VHPFRIIASIVSWMCRFLVSLRRQFDLLNEKRVGPASNHRVHERAITRTIGPLTTPNSKRSFACPARRPPDRDRSDSQLDSQAGAIRWTRLEAMDSAPSVSQRSRTGRTPMDDQQPIS
jgi:hypothetical protein